MNIVVSRNYALSRFDIHVDGELAGFADYKLNEQTMVFPHTETLTAEFWIDFGMRENNCLVTEFVISKACQVPINANIKARQSVVTRNDDIH